MPSLGADMDAGTVAQWLVHPGDEVHRGDIVAVVETEKSTIEVEVFESGRIEELVVAEGEKVPVGTVLARLSPLGSPVEAETGAPPPAVPVQPERAGPVVVPAPVLAAHGVVVSPVLRRLAGTLGVELDEVPGTGRGGRVTRQDVEHAPRHTVSGAPMAPPAASARARVSPRARRLAAELGVDVGSLPGSGPLGAVTGDDVARDADAHGAPSSEAHRAPRGHAPSDGAAPPGEATDDRRLAMRRAIGALMARSKREIPHYYLSTTVDMRAAASWLEAENRARPVTARLVVPVLLLKATARAVATVPEMNGFMTEEGFQPADHVHLGVAVSLRGGGVVAPAIHDADRRPVDELMAALRDLVTRARRGVLRSSEMSDPTITVSNLGELGVDEVFGVIYPPQVALVGFGRLAERPWAEHGLLGVRPQLTATLSADHRVSDGHRGGLFLSTIDQLLQAPEDL